MKPPTPADVGTVSAAAIQEARRRAFADPASRAELKGVLLRAKRVGATKEETRLAILLVLALGVRPDVCDAGEEP